MSIAFLLALSCCLFARVHEAGKIAGNVHLQVIPELMTLRDRDGHTLLNASNCESAKWKYSIQLENYDWKCLGDLDCVNYGESLGYNLYFTVEPYEVIDTFEKIAKKFDEKTVWLRLTIFSLKERANTQHDFKYPFMISMNKENRDDTLGTKSYQVESKSPREMISGFFSFTVYVICGQNFTGPKCNQLKLNNLADMALVDNPTSVCSGTKIFNDEELEPNDDKSVFQPMVEDSPKKCPVYPNDWLSNRNFVLIVITCLAVLCALLLVSICLMIIKYYSHKLHYKSINAQSL